METNFNIENCLPDSANVDSRMNSLSRIAAISKKQELSDKDKSELASAARGFEAMFMNMLLKEMKFGMPESQGSSNFGSDTIMGYANLELAEHFSNVGSGIGIADKIYQYYTGEKLPAVTTENLHQDAAVQVPAEIQEKKAMLGLQSGRMQPQGNLLQKVTGRIAPYERHIAEASEKFDVPGSLIKAVITAESAGNPEAKSRAGAKGLMQLMDGAASEMGVTNPYDARQNIFGGTGCLSKMLEMFDDDLDRALAGYNAGPGNVMKYGGIPPFKETKAYISRVHRYLDQFPH